MKSRLIIIWLPVAVIGLSLPEWLRILLNIVWSE
jgi:hypothetical protein